MPDSIQFLILEGCNALLNNSSLFLNELLNFIINNVLHV